MLLKIIFFAILIYFLYAAVRNLIHAVRVDATSQHRIDPNRDTFRTSSKNTGRGWHPPRQEPPPAHVYRSGEATEEVQDAKWKDL